MIHQFFVFFFILQKYVLKCERTNFEQQNAGVSDETNKFSVVYVGVQSMYGIYIYTTVLLKLVLILTVLNNKQRPT